MLTVQCERDGGRIMSAAGLCMQDASSCGELEFGCEGQQTGEIRVRPVG